MKRRRIFARRWNCTWRRWRRLASQFRNLPLTSILWNCRSSRRNRDRDRIVGKENCNLNKKIATITLALAAAPFALAQAQQKQTPPPKQPMSFFVTSEGLGKGANLGGLAGADAHCQKLAAAAGAGNRTWRAYLSTNAADGQSAV